MGLVKALRAALIGQRRSEPVLMVPSIASPEALLQAWQRVRANQGAAGGDGVTLSAFAAKLEVNLQRLSCELIERRYRPGPLRRVAIPKPDGRLRVLSIPCIRDRIAQTSALALLEGLLDARQSSASFAYRPALGVAHALSAVQKAHAEGFYWTFEADIRDFFPSVSHRRLMADLAVWIEAEDMLGLIGTWLIGFSPKGRGLAQGAPISPLLANLFLHPIDRMLSAAGHRPARYADDFVVLARSERAACTARAMAAALLRDRGLGLHPNKSAIRRPGEAFQFLGVTLRSAEIEA